jgi:hypothetical protein
MNFNFLFLTDPFVSNSSSQLILLILLFILATVADEKYVYDDISNELKHTNIVNTLAPTRCKLYLTNEWNRVFCIVGNSSLSLTKTASSSLLFFWKDNDSVWISNLGSHIGRTSYHVNVGSCNHNTRPIWDSPENTRWFLDWTRTM